MGQTSLMLLEGIKYFVPIFEAVHALVYYV